MVLLGASPPQNDLRLGENRAGAHADREFRRVEIERASVAQDVACGGAPELNRNLPVADIHERVRDARQGDLDLCGDALCGALGREEQPFIGTEPEHRPRAFRIRAASDLRQRDAESLTCRRTRRRPALHHEARGGIEHPERVPDFRHATALLQGRETPDSSL
jgi:hypothetical protein